VLRGDLDSIVVGRDSNVQDNAVVHVDRGLPALIGRRVTVGHAAVVHGCSIGDDCLVGMNRRSTVARWSARIGRRERAVVRENASFPRGLIAGVPAKTIRSVDETLRRRIELSWPIYRELAKASLPARPRLKRSFEAVSLDLSAEFTRLVREE